MLMVDPERIAQVNECLGEASELADKFNARQYDFADRVADWLKELESATRDAGLSVFPRMAELRIGLDAARHGLSAIPDGHVRMTPRKARNMAAQHAVRSAIELVSNAIVPIESRRIRAENIALTVVARSFEKALWPGQSDAPGAPTDMPSMWRALMADPGLRPQVMELSTLLGVSQSMLLVARTMNAFAGNSERNE